MGAVIEKDVYLSRFAELEQSRNGDTEMMAEIRRRAIGRFEKLGFPTLRHEDWKYTNVAALKNVRFRAVATGHGAIPSSEEVASCSVTSRDSEAFTRLVFIDGRFEASLSDVGSGSWTDGGPSTGGATAGTLDSLARILSNGGSAVLKDHLGQHLGAYDDHPFALINSALFEDGAVLHVPEGTVIDRPVHLVFLRTESSEPTMTHPRILIVLEAAAQLTVVEEYSDLGPAGSMRSTGQVRFTNSLTEASIAESAVLDHYRFLREGDNSFHISAMGTRQAKSSTLRSTSISLGGGLVRNDVTALLAGVGCECTLNGLVVAREKQHVDNHTKIVHSEPGSKSWEVYKAVLGDNATGVFNGKIYVDQKAQKTDAKQTNKSLLLSEKAVMNSKPELEIYADDVKCTHGATVGQLDRDAMFYMQTRGIDEETARNMLTYAFSSEIVEQIAIDSLRDAVRTLLISRLPQQTSLRDVGRDER